MSAKDIKKETPISGPPRASCKRRDVVRDALSRHPLESEVLERRQERITDILLQRLASVTVVAENIYDPHNVSAIVRSAEGFGVDTVNVVDRELWFAPNKQIVKGSDKWVEIHHHKSLMDCLSAIKEQGFITAAADVGKGTIPLAEIPIDKPVAIVMGSEKDGLSKQAKSFADVRFTIPMQGFVESFNVSVSAAIALYETTRRRREFLAEPGDLDDETLKLRVDQWMKRSVQRRRVKQLEIAKPHLK